MGGLVRKIGKHGKKVQRRDPGNRVAFSKSASSTNPDRKLPEGKKEGFYRSKGTIKRLNMYKEKGVLDKTQAKAPQRIAPDRRWFGNTRTISQDKMTTFREELSKSVNDPFSVVIKASKLPMALLTDPEKDAKMNLLSIEPFNDTFGKKAQRKKPKLAAYDMEALAESSAKMEAKYTEKNHDRDLAEVKELESVTGVREKVSEYIFNKGTSRRIWAELYKVIDSSDIILEVIDARDPMGTRCIPLEREVKKNHPHKHIVLILNKCDLVPTWVTKKWVKTLSKEFPTLAFHASVTNPFGKGALIQLLRQFGGLLKDRKHVSIGLVGYPNVGKSSVINALKHKKVCKAAPVPGETKVWQFVSLTKRLFLIDCPGIVPPTQTDWAADCAKVLKGVVRAERIDQPSNYVDEVLERVKKEYLLQRYRLPETTVWTDTEDFLTQLAKKLGKLKKGAEADIETVARIVLYDWQRGRIPYFTLPPKVETEEDEEEKANVDENIAEREKVLQNVASRQCLDDLACEMEFDDQDGNDPNPEKVEAKRPREEEGVQAEAEDKPKKKARRGKKGLGGGEKANFVTQAVDWTKVTDEFDA